MSLYIQRIETPVGPLNAYSDGASLLGVYFAHNDFFPEAAQAKKSKNQLGVFQQLEQQLEEYFKKTRSHFDLPLKWSGTAFQRRAWQALLKIPHGKTSSYQEQARKIRSKAVRAIGSANGKNPFVVIVPCHRVVRSSGELGGYSGGIKIKRDLLRLEGAN